MPLSILINKSFITGVFPNICKIAKAVSIFKSETRFVCNNYRQNQTIGILSKLRYNTSLPILKIVYHSLFGSHLQYGAQLWGQGNCVNQNNKKPSEPSTQENYF